MTRRVSAEAAMALVMPLLIVYAIFNLMLPDRFVEALQNVRYRTTVIGKMSEAVTFFLPIPISSESSQLAQAGLSVSRILMVGVSICLIYLTCRSLSRVGRPRQSIWLISGAILLAAVLADFASQLLIILLGLFWLRLDSSVAIAVGTGYHDAAIFGLVYALGIGLIWPRIASSMLRDAKFWDLQTHDTAQEYAKGSRGSSLPPLGLPLAAVSPILLVMFYGGRDEFTYITRESGEFEAATWFSSFGRGFLFPYYLRPVPPVVARDPADLMPDAPPIDLVEYWLAPSLNALLFCAVLMLIVAAAAWSRMSAEFANSGWFLMGWVSAVWAGLIGGILSALAETLFFNGSAFHFMSNSQIMSLTFGAVWGWVSGIACVLATRNRWSSPAKAQRKQSD